MKTYSEKLKDPLWQKKRLEVLNRDDFTCQLCGDKKTTLHIHHKKYSQGEPWEIDNEFLVTLCKHCHLIEEQFKNSEFKILSLVKYPYIEGSTGLLAYIQNPQKDFKLFLFTIEGEIITETMMTPMNAVDHVIKKAKKDGLPIH